jgi:hypothetical protein
VAAGEGLPRVAALRSPPMLLVGTYVYRCGVVPSAIYLCDAEVLTGISPVSHIGACFCYVSMEATAGVTMQWAHRGG